MHKFIREKYKLIILLFLIVTVAISVMGAAEDTMIYDEDAHIPAGYSYLKTFDMRLNPEHPPLIKDLAVLPLLFFNPQPTFDTSKPFWNEDANDAQWDAGKEFLFQSGNNPDKIIFWSRLPIILLFVILGLFIFKWTKELAGVGAGLLAFTLFIFDPNILGHNHFVTTDLGIAAFITFAFYYFIRFIKEPTWKNVSTLSLFLALVQLAKFSDVLIFPIFGLVLIVYPLVKKARVAEENTLHFKLKNFGEYLGKFTVALVISIVVVWIAYYFTTFNMPKDQLPKIVDHYFVDGSLKTTYAKQFIFALNRYDFLRPMAVYLFGIARVFQRVGGGNVTYFLGQVSTHGFYSYFPLVFLIKEPIASLALMLGALGITGLGIFRITKRKTIQELADYVRSRITELSMIAFILLYVFTSIVGRLNIGFRHLFPIFPFIFILTAKVIFDFIKKIKHRRNKTVAYIVVTFIAIVLILKTLLAYPFYLSYFNEFADGPKNGYHYVTDSNADWGQDLKRLEKFIDRYNWCPENSLDSLCKIYDPQKGQIEKIRLDYFGMADLNYYMKDGYIPWWASKRPIEPGWYGISTLFLQQGIYDAKLKNNESYRWLKNKKPFYQVGTSILIYYITPQEANKIN